MHYDILFNIGLWCNLKKSIAIIASCKNMWLMRKEFYHRKHLLYYHKPSLEFWTPEQHFYASGQQFMLLINDITMYMEVSYLYEYNNTIKHLMQEIDYDYTPLFYIQKQWLVIYCNHALENDRDTDWSFDFYAQKEEMFNVIKNIKPTVGYVKYTVIDLSKSMPCWSRFNAQPLLNDYTEHIFQNSLGKIVSGE